MRIIAGRFKGRKLAHFSSPAIRPMTNRVKTSVFDTLQSYTSFENQHVLDLFAGTGGLSFEALSRGAGASSMVDNGREFITLAQKNIEHLKLTTGLALYSQDVFRFLLSYGQKPINGLTLTPPGRLKKKQTPPGRPKSFDLIFAAPPFNKKWGIKVLKLLNESKTWQKGSILVLEISRQEDTPPIKNQMRLFTAKHFGDKKTLFYEWI